MVRPDLPPPPTGAYPSQPSPGDLVRDSGLDPEAFDPAPVPETHARAKAGPKGPPGRATRVEPAPKRRGGTKAKADDDSAVTDFLKSREGRATVNNVVRGVFDLLKKKR